MISIRSYPYEHEAIQYIHEFTWLEHHVAVLSQSPVVTPQDETTAIRGFAQILKRQDIPSKG